MAVEIREVSIASLADHGEISIAFRVEQVLDVSIDDRGLRGIKLEERQLDHPYVRDYDAVVGEGPTIWPKRFDLSNWGLLAAFQNGERIGGALIAFDTAGLWLLDGRTDLAAVWDLRVRPQVRRQGIGSALFAAAEDWARHHQCGQLKVETQNTNVAACRFYARNGCALGGINRHAYRELPGETQLLWFKDLWRPGDQGFGLQEDPTS